ncbi:hypothetical protein SCUCBS95973_001393 [Sporothrix curviconia]|uniref:F-box domain-containing protein n=1 Tax=Sporothrix curviconia TaxID=1260050 RepID=A0ABP0AY60_9PEZI
MATCLDSWPLPGELIDATLDLLEPRDLARVSQVCRTLHVRASQSRWWQKFVQRNLPSVCGPVAATPLPAHLPTFRDLYVAHESRWFLPRHKIWITGSDMVGKVVIARYDPRRGCIEGYQLVAVSRGTQTLSWPPDPEVIVQAFQPEVSIHLDRPVLKLDALALLHEMQQPASRPASTAASSAREAGGKDRGKGKARAEDNDDEEDENGADDNEPQEEANGGANGGAEAEGDSNAEQPPQKRPKISFYQPPGTSFSWGAYVQAINSDTPAIDPICPSVRPILMDLDGSRPTRSNGRPVRVLPASSSIRIRRQFIFARPLSLEQAYHGGLHITYPNSRNTPPREEELIADADAADDFAVDRRSINRRSTIPYPQYSIWPPPELPAPHRVRAKDIGPHHYPRGPVGQPRLRNDVSERAFHVRTYLDANTGMQRAITMLKPVRPVRTGASPAGAPTSAAPAEQPTAGSSSSSSAPETAPAAANGGSVPAAATPEHGFLYPHQLLTPTASRGDTLETYATLDPYYYTPTADRPFRGIFVGDYSSHGCEFLLVHQADKVLESEKPASDSASSSNGLPPSFVVAAPDASAAPGRLDSESDEAYARRVRDDRIYQGSIRAIKLTGDPNVPRGEVSFLAPDLGASGLDTVLQDAPFAGVRVVRSRGHIAGTRFVNDRWVDTRLLLISPDRLAIFWIAFGHVSFFERVDIDKFVDPLKT